MKLVVICCWSNLSNRFVYSNSRLRHAFWVQLPLLDGHALYSCSPSKSHSKRDAGNVAA